MLDNNRATKNMLILLAIIFLACLISIVILNSHTQTKNFWDNQQAKLAFITESCVDQINSWAILHEMILRNVALELESGRILSIEQRQEYLVDVVELSPDILFAYVVFDDGSVYMNSGADVIDVEIADFTEWYELAKNSEGEIVFSEPYMDSISHRLVISCLKSIRLPDGIVCVAGIDITLDDLNQRINSLRPSANGGAWTTSPQGKVMTYIDPEFLPKIVDGQASFLNAQDVMDKVVILDVNDQFLDRGIEICRIIDYDGMEKYEAITAIPATRWILGVNIPMVDYDADVRQVVRNQYYIIFIAMLMSIISIVFAYVIIKSFKKQQILKKNMEIAQIGSQTKSDFLSRMSHEIRTPMNAIIGMTKIAENTNDTNRLRYCISTIQSSSTHLLGLINDILDMSKIESGKFELDPIPMSIEKMLMNTCNLIVEKIEQKGISFSIVLGKGLKIHYIADELRLSQVVTNLLSNAVKFTPEGGTISLSVDELSKENEYSTLRFIVKDTGIGMTKSQMEKLFNAFEQVDGSISRQFGGTGLGLVISKSIVEKMDGKINVESEYGKGTSFVFDVVLKRMEDKNGPVIFGNIRPQDLRILVAEYDDETRKYFKTIVNGFGMNCDDNNNAAGMIEQVTAAKEANRPYDVIFLDYHLPDMNAAEAIVELNGIIDKNTVVIITSYLDRSSIENAVRELRVEKFITKPLFPSVILDMINEVIGSTLKELDIQSETEAQTPDFSDVTLLLVEDVEINREIFITLLEDTGVKIDTAENGIEALRMFSEHQQKYDLIIMDVQMPVMDGYEATRRIRATGSNKAINIPIIAMTANAFKEDIEKCLESGMNDHLAKPIDLDAVLEKLSYYSKRK